MLGYHQPRVVEHGVELRMGEREALLAHWLRIVANARQYWAPKYTFRLSYTTRPAAPRTRNSALAFCSQHADNWHDSEPSRISRSFIVTKGVTRESTREELGVRNGSRTPAALTEWETQEFTFDAAGGGSSRRS
jgi:hypothetical protein